MRISELCKRQSSLQKFSLQWLRETFEFIGWKHEIWDRIASSSSAEWSQTSQVLFLELCFSSTSRHFFKWMTWEVLIHMESPWSDPLHISQEKSREKSNEGIETSDSSHVALGWRFGSDWELPYPLSPLLILKCRTVQIVCHKLSFFSVRGVIN